MDRKKYIVEASDDVKKVMAMGVTHGGAIWTDTTDIENLEELNSDYINEHFGDLQNEAYKRGFEDGKESIHKGCEGCQFEGTEIYLRPCSACRNAYPNQWAAKKQDDGIKVENERMKAKRVMHEDCAFLYWTCSNCNSLVLEHDNFCSNCGADFRRNEDGEEKNNDEN